MYVERWKDCSRSLCMSVTNLISFVYLLLIIMRVKRINGKGKQGRNNMQSMNIKTLFLCISPAEHSPIYLHADLFLLVHIFVSGGLLVKVLSVIFIIQYWRVIGKSTIFTSFSPSWIHFIFKIRKDFCKSFFLSPAIASERSKCRFRNDLL